MTTTKRVLRLYAAYKGYIAVLCAGIPAIALLNVQSQTILGSIVDAITSADLFAPLVSKYVLIVAAQFIAKQGYAIVEGRLLFQVIHRLRTAIADKVLRIKAVRLERYAPGEVLQMWNNDVEALQTLSIQTVFGFLISAGSGLLAMIKLWQLSVYFPIIAVAINLVTILPIQYIGKRNKRAAQARRASEVAMNEKFYTLLGAIRLVKSYGKERAEIDQFERVNDAYIDSKMSANVAERVYRSALLAINAMGPTLVIILASLQVKRGGLTIGDIVMSITLLATVNQPFGEIGNFIVSLKAIGFKFNALFDFLGEAEERLDGRKLEAGEGFSLALAGVSLDIGDARLVEDISLSIGAGEKIGVVGESGSGKTTLNSLILRVHEPTSGAILLNGRDVREYSIEDYRQHIQYSQSNVYLIHDTIESNLRVAGASHDRVVAAARGIGFHGEILAMPDGYGAMIDASGSNVSGGQKKKMEIVRAIAQTPRDLYVFDEITRGIDGAAAGVVMDYLLDQMPGTALFTMHNIEGAERLDKIVVMRSGRIVDVGKHEALVERCEYYRTLHANRAKGGDGDGRGQ